MPNISQTVWQYACNRWCWLTVTVWLSLYSFKNLFHFFRCTSLWFVFSLQMDLDSNASNTLPLKSRKDLLLNTRRGLNLDDYVWKFNLKCTISFAKVITFFRFGSCLLYFIIFDHKSTTSIVWSMVKMFLLLLWMPNISVQYGLRVENMEALLLHSLRVDLNSNHFVFVRIVPFVQE